MNLPVTEQERTFPSDQRLISTTDLNSRITYCNDAFVAISGFTYDELVGQPHNLVRHPDMPPSVFGHMWETIKQGKPWMGWSRTAPRTVISIGSAPTSRPSMKMAGSAATSRYVRSRPVTRFAVPRRFMRVCVADARQCLGPHASGPGCNMACR